MFYCNKSKCYSINLAKCVSISYTNALFPSVYNAKQFTSTI